MNIKDTVANPAEVRNVSIETGLFGKISDIMREQVIPYQWEILNDRAVDAKPDHSIENFSVANSEDQVDFPSHCIANFKIAAGEQKGNFYGMVFQDSDLAKWLEAVAYSLMTHPDTKLEKTADDAIALIGRAQQEDGYLNTYFTIKEPGKRFTNLCECHELYCAGHMMEAAVAYYQATGKRELLNIMMRMAQCINRVLGPREEGKLPGYPGHEEIELALVKMFRVTGNPMLLKLASYFINERGKKPYYFDEEFIRRNKASHFSYLYPPFGMYSNGPEYEQYHLPVREQKEFVGHAVRCMYLACGMADVAAETNDQSLVDACKTLFENMAQKRMYVTGGIGSTPKAEMFTYDYDLPNDMVYGETCASVGLVFFMQRMLMLEQNSKYSNVMERALFNTCIAGMSLDGKRFFYVNPLEVDPAISKHNPDRKHVLAERPAWFGCACCPPNLARLVTSLGAYLYSVKGNSIYMHLYMSNRLSMKVDKQDVTLDVKTKYPYEGKIVITASKGIYSILLRIPDWSEAYSIRVNGESENSTLEHGYARVERIWRDGDEIELTLDMTPRRVYANPKVSQDVGKVAIQRGPLVYCLEGIDNGPGLQQIYLPKDAELHAVDAPDQLNGIYEIKAKGLRLKNTENSSLYSYNSHTQFEPTELTFIPYYTWANRGENEMTVWVHEQI